MASDAESLAAIKFTVDAGLACLLSKTEIIWLIQRVEQLEKENQNLRDALASD
jgi:hypothetical protein